MQIVHVILTKRFAGSERYAIELANAQSARHDVSVILRQAALQQRADALAQHVDGRVNLLAVSDWGARAQVRALVARMQPEVVHAHLSLACKSLRRVRGPSLRVATLHIRYKPRQHAHMDALVAIAPWQLAGVHRRLRAHTLQIDNWTMPHVADAAAREQLRREHSIPAGAFVIGALGRIESSKGFDILIAAFNRLRLPTARDVYLVVVGDGPQRAKLRNNANSRVLLPGFSTEPKNWLRAFDCFVSSARSEPFGLVFLEAMQAGLPVLATRSQGALHLAPTMQPILVPLGDEAALTVALQRWVDTPPPRQVYDLEPFQMEQQLPKFDAFYRRERARLVAGAAMTHVEA